MDTLFHYTTAAGLLGILKSSAFWATDLRFLNDAQEAVYARELFVEAVRNTDNPALQAGHPLHDMAQSFGQEFAAYKELVANKLLSPDFPVYVTCFCESSDLLSLDPPIRDCGRCSSDAARARRAGARVA
jgi:hypothetical protein